jgi:hypothetical protein
MTSNHLITIPRGLEAQPCSGCGAPIYWAPHPSTGRAHPVSYNPDVALGCRRPTPYLDGAGISHFADCPDADRFRKPKEQRA